MGHIILEQFDQLINAILLKYELLGNMYKLFGDIKDIQRQMFEIIQIYCLRVKVHQDHQNRVCFKIKLLNLDTNQLNKLKVRGK